MSLKQSASYKCFGGTQSVYTHKSKTNDCTMTFALFMPEGAKDKKVPALLFLSGLTCTEQNFITKAGAQKRANELNMALVVCDTSPRGEGVANDENYDLGQGAGFYLNATQDPWAAHFQMYDYVTKEFMPLCEQEFAISAWSLSGHSMGGHGALTLYLKDPARFKSCSAFSPIVAPSVVPWGKKAFSAYLSKDESTWAEYDACELLKSGHKSESEILIDQGLADSFLEEQLQTHLLQQACDEAGQKVRIRMQEGYDHSFYFIASFIDEHLEFHAKAHQKSAL